MFCEKWDLEKIQSSDNAQRRLKEECRLEATWLECGTNSNVPVL